MGDEKLHRNTILRARQVKGMVDELYEPGRLDRCKMWVYRYHVRKVYNISVRTFFSTSQLPICSYPKKHKKWKIKDSYAYLIKRMETIQIIHNTILMFATQLVFISTRTWNVKAIAKGNMLHTLISGAIVNISWLVSMGLGGVSMYNIINDFQWYYVPIVCACVLGGVAGAYIGMKEKKSTICKTSIQQ